MKKNRILIAVLVLVTALTLFGCNLDKKKSDTVEMTDKYMYVNNDDGTKNIVGFSKFGKGQDDFVVDRTDIKHWGDDAVISYNWDKPNLDATNNVKKVYFKNPMSFMLQENGICFQDFRNVGKAILQNGDASLYSATKGGVATKDITKAFNGKFIVPFGSLAAFNAKFDGDFEEANVTFFADEKLYWSDHITNNAYIKYVPTSPTKDNMIFKGWSKTPGGVVENSLAALKMDGTRIVLYAVFDIK